MKYKPGDEVLVKGAITDLHEGTDHPYFVAVNYDSVHWVSEDKIIPMDKTYVDGLNDAWNLAKKLANLSSNEFAEIFGAKGLYSIICCFSYEEALAKIEAYEKEKEIKVGDVVSDNCSFGLVTRKEGGLLYVMMADGSCGEDEEPESWHKTGKHIDIESLLKEIGE